MKQKDKNNLLILLIVLVLLSIFILIFLLILLFSSRRKIILISINKNDDFYDKLLLLSQALSDYPQKKIMIVFKNEDDYRYFANFFEPNNDTWIVKHSGLKFLKYCNQKMNEQKFWKNYTENISRIKQDFFKPKIQFTSKKKNSLIYMEELDLDYLQKDKSNVAFALKLFNKKILSKFNDNNLNKKLVFFSKKEITTTNTLLDNINSILKNGLPEVLICSFTSSLGKLLIFFKNNNNNNKNENENDVFYHFHPKNNTLVLTTTTLDILEPEPKKFNLHGASFGTVNTGLYSFQKSLNRIQKEMENTGLFSSVRTYNETSPIMKPFLERHKNFQQKRGFKYWIWKPYLILETLKQIPENDYLLFVDCGDTIQSRDSYQIHEFLQLVNNNPDLFLFCHEINEIQYVWTKEDLFHYLKIEPNDPVRSKNQVEGGHVLIKNCPEARNFVNMWYSISCAENYHLVDDTPSRLANHKDFIEHRHDQSIYSLLKSLHHLPSFDMSVIAIGTRLRE
jgi:hypothetical protein